MSVDKFRFVSPGVYVNEIDETGIPRLPGPTGPAIIGTSEKGPIMRPVVLKDYQDFEAVFGAPSPGDAYSSPTYGAFAARAYKARGRGIGNVTFVRLGGFQHENASEQGKAGWKMNNAYGLFVLPVNSGSNGYDATGSVAANAPLAAIIYTSGSDYGLSGKKLDGTSVATAVTGTWIMANANNLEFTISVDGSPQIIDFSGGDKHISKILNTNPVKTNSNIATEPDDYFLSEVYTDFVVNKVGSINNKNFAGVLVKLNNADAGVDFANFKEGAKEAQSGWIVSQDTFATGSFEAGPDGFYPSVKKLFKVVGLTEGKWANEKIVISIENIKQGSTYQPYGTFDLVVRDATKASLPQLKVYSGLNLDPNSANYIAKKVGDKYRKWDYDRAEYVEYNTYENNDKDIRVEMHPDVNAGLLDKSLLPFGFYAPPKFADAKVSGSFIESGIPFIDGDITGSNEISASFMLPEIPVVSSSTSDSILGINMKKGAIINPDITHYLSSKPVNFTDRPAFLFSLDDLSGSYVGTTLRSVTWNIGNRKGNNSLTSNNKLSEIIEKGFNKFQFALAGGSDGINKLEKNPFAKSILEASENETENYAYNSVKVAIDSISNAEIVDMNVAAMPGIDTTSLTNMLIEKCANRGDALAIIDLDGDYNPENGSVNLDVKTVVSNLRARSLNNSYGCAYFPWVRTAENNIPLPPSVAALGVFGHTESTNELWFAPAGFNRGGLSNVGLASPVMQLSAKERDELYENNINPIANFPGNGVVIFGQKTLQVTPSALDRINVRRMMIYVKKEISRMATNVLFDPNVQVTWSRFTNLAVPFLQNVKSRFGLSDFRVVLDETTTTSELVDRNIVYAKIMLKPTRSIEFIALDFVIAPTGASFDQ